MTTPATESNTTHANATVPRDKPNKWARPGLMACAVVLAIAYGSLIPFDFEWSREVHDAGGVLPALLNTLTSPAWTSAGDGASSLGVSFAVSDLAMNLLLYLPLGVTLRMAIRARWRSIGTVEVFAATVLAFLLSWGVESVQGLMASRVASLNDIAANTSAALAAALLAPHLWGFYKRVSFELYCRMTRFALPIRRWLARPGVVMVIAIANATVIGLWYLGELQRSGVTQGGVVALPFERAFSLPYDLGVLILGQALLAYAGIGCLLLLLTYTGARRLAMNWVVLGVVLIAFAAELSRAVTHNSAPDVTGPLLALAAAAIMAVTLYTFTLAVKRSNRRQQSQGFDGPDRRAAPHDYGSNS